MGADLLEEGIERRLGETRRDPQRMRRYDRDGDRHIGAEEWEEVRRVVSAEILGGRRREKQRVG